MKRNFYLQHPLMAMHDPRMQYLLKMEKLKGTGAYWFVIEKLAMLPGSCVDMEFLRPYCKMHKISFAYVKKIILGYELFDFEEDGSFAPAELNPLHKSVQKREETVADKTGKPEDSVRKTVPKTTGNVSESSVSWSKNDEKRQKTSREKAAKRTEKSDKTLNDSIISESVDTDNKENIKDILTTAAEEKERNAAAADFSNVESRRTDAAACCTVATVQRSQCHTSPLKCGIWEGHLPASLSLPQRSTAVTAKYFFAVQKRTGAYVYSVPCTRWAIIFSGLEVSTG